jgi:DNA-binding NarL/FixJ family response regulator
MNAASSESSPPPARLRTFVVEDSSVIRDNLRETLEENAPIQVVGSAEDEKAAVAWMRSHKAQCDLVIVDIFLKQGSGLGVLKGLAELDGGARKVVLSNHATPEIRAKCAELGAEKVFDKSNELEEMLRWFNRIGGEGRSAYDA